MSKYLCIITFFILAFANNSKACDLCGCGAGSDYAFGVLPQYHRNFVGVRYLYRTFDSQHEAGMLQMGNTYERYQTADILARWYVTPRLQLLAALPYQSFARIENTQTQYLQGVGDASILVNYIVWQKTSLDTSRLLTQKILLGGGVKLPTGNAQNLAENGARNPNFQVGTGTFDFLANASYQWRYNHWGANTTVAYRYNLSDATGYRFGNSLRANTQFFYWYQAKKWVLLPALGAQYEQNDHDRKTTGFYNEQTGGTAWWATANLDAYYKNWAFGVSYQLPLSQNLNGGLTTASPRLQAQAFYAF